MSIPTGARSGKGGQVSLEGTTLRMQEWTTDDHGDDLDTTDFESEGFDCGLIGIRGCDWSFKGLWDADQNPIGNPPNIEPADDAGPLVLTTNVTDGQAYTLDVIRILKVTITTPVRGTVQFAVSGKSNGNFSSL